MDPNRYLIVLAGMAVFSAILAGGTFIMLMHHWLQ